MKVILKKAVVVVTIGMMAMLQSCSSNDDLDGYTPTNFNVGGKVEKGPFVRGTAIQMQPLDADLDETGESFTSTITDNEGTFTFGSKLLKSPYVKLSASGYYFNEVTGELSKGTLALNAVANLQNAADVNLNILSHLKYQRVMDLVAKDGKSFKEANNQAQEEVLKTFGLEKYAKTDVNHFSITSGTDEAAALIRDGKATGTALQQFALMAQMAVEQADAYLNGTAPEEEKQLVPCVAITADNTDCLNAFVYTEPEAK
mgnify:CR=1 FL=1